MPPALRSLRRQPGFTIVAVLTLALGIGASTAIFSVVNGVLLRSAPFDEMDRLMMVWETDRASGTTREPASFPDFVDFQERSDRFETFGALMGIQRNGAIDQATSFRVTGLAVTHELLPMLGVGPVLGRAFTPEDTRRTGPAVALISEGLWSRVLGGDRAVLGRAVHLDEVPYTIVGVIPDEADLGVLQILSAAAYSRAFADRGTREEVDVWVPLQADAEVFPRATHPIFVIGRAKAGVPLESLQEELGVIAADLERAYPENDARGVFVEPLADVVFGEARPALLLLLGAVGLVLLVACANVANLLLVRTTARVREVAVRQALGADGLRLGRQFLAESLLLAVTGGGVGVVLAAAGVGVLTRLAPASIPRLTDVEIDARVLAVALALTLGVSVIFGLVPALQAWRVDLQSSLKSAGRAGGSTGRRRTLVRPALVVAEMAMAVLLVVGAGLLLRSFWTLLQVDPGFRAGGVLKAEYQLPSTRYPRDFAVWPAWPQVAAFNDALVERAANLPGVMSAAIAGSHPLDAGFTNSFFVIGRQAEAREWPELSMRAVTPAYFRTVGLPLVRGRLLDDADSADAPRVVLVNEAAAARFFAGQDPLGQELAFWGSRWRIVGIVSNERFHGLAAPPPIAAYVPLEQSPSGTGAHALLVRVDGDPATFTAVVERTVREIDPGLAVFGTEPLQRTVSRSVAQRRFLVTLIGVFAGLTMLLAAVGIYGVLSYDVARRAPEIGIRMALGARAGGIIKEVVAEGLGLTAIGLTIGLAGALAVSRFLSTLLFGVAPTDPLTFASVAVVVLAVALVASLVPARRAARVDPMHALRQE